MTHPYGPPQGHPGNPDPAEPADPAAPAWGARQTTASRTPWRMLTATALGAALLASGATAGLSRLLDTDQRGAAGAVAVQDASTGAPFETTGAETAAETVPVAGSTATNPDWQAVADAVRPSVVAIDVATRSGNGQGSGVVLDTEGHVLTNDHVVGQAQELRVTLADGRVYAADLVGTDPTTDLAVIVLTDPPADLVPAAQGDSDEVAVGAPVMAVGNPLGLDSTVTTGIVSAVDRPVTTGRQRDTAVVTNAIQIDAAINPGNSGGPLFDATGRVIGINSSIATLSQTTGSIGLGFAIPANLAGRVADQLVTDGTVEHAYLGVGLRDGTATVDGTTRLGAVVGEVAPGSPAAAAGVRTGDVVVAIDGDAVGGAESLTASVRERAVGTEVMLTVVRDGVGLDLATTLAPRADR